MRKSVLLLRFACVLILWMTMVEDYSAFAQEVPHKVKFMAKFETRSSFVQTHYAAFLGVRAGFQLKFPVRFGLGYYWLFTKMDSRLYRAPIQGQGSAKAQPRMRYAIGYVDYSFYEEDDWELSVPVQIGIGESYYSNTTSDRFENGLIVPMEAGVGISYLFTRWAGFGVGLGYRLMLLNNRKVKENFNSPYYQIRIIVLFTEMFKEAKSRRER